MNQDLESLKARVRHLSVMIFDIDGTLTDGRMELLKVPADRCGYMGDEGVDLPLLKAVGFSATPPEAPDEVRAQVHSVAQRPAGFGAAREVCEFILRHRQKG